MTSQAPRWRPITWAILGFVVLIALSLVGVVLLSTDHCLAALPAANVPDADLARQTCRSETAHDVFRILSFGQIGLLILGAVWWRTRPARRLCPACATPVAAGLTVCPVCGHDFAAVARAAGASA